MATMKVKKGDTVFVIAGNDASKTGKVLSVDPKNRTVIVEGVAMITKHQKPRSVHQQGGRITKEAPIHVSNVMVICDKCNKPTRVGMKILGEGKDKKKVRICKKCNSEIKTPEYKKD